MSFSPQKVEENKKGKKETGKGKHNPNFKDISCNIANKLSSKYNMLES